MKKQINQKKKKIVLEAEEVYVDNFFDQYEEVTKSYEKALNNGRWQDFDGVIIAILTKQEEQKEATEQPESSHNTIQKSASGENLGNNISESPKIPDSKSLVQNPQEKQGANETDSKGDPTSQPSRKKLYIGLGIVGFLLVVALIIYGTGVYEKYFTSKDNTIPNEIVNEDNNEI